MSSAAKLIFLCGKMAAGKSTLAKELALQNDAVLLEQDDFLEKLFPGEITDIPSFLERSTRLQNALTPLVCVLLLNGVSVVLDFPANTRRQRAWFLELLQRTNVEHELHYVDATDAVCKRQLRERSAHLPPGSAWTLDAEFDAITVYFLPPEDEEQFNVVRHVRE